VSRSRTPSRTPSGSPSSGTHSITPRSTTTPPTTTAPRSRCRSTTATTFTGITDADRALTITEVANAAAAATADPDAYSPEAFAASFRAPGHVHVLRGAVDGLDERVGHTELGLALAEAVDAAPAAVVCEMLDDETGDALAPADAAAYAARHDIPYVEGAALVEALR